MLEIVIPERELFDEDTMTFLQQKKQTLQLEHSLVSISKWESKWCVPFFSTQKTTEQTIDYIRCMTITQNVNPEVYLSLPSDILKTIKEYINDTMTATWFAKRTEGSRNKRIVTVEVIYYWMIALNIPFECQKWHINRLVTLIQVCNDENQPPKKRSRKELLAERVAVNAARKAKYQTKG